MCVWVHVLVCTCTWGGLELTLGVFLDCSPLLFVEGGSLAQPRAQEFLQL